MEFRAMTGQIFIYGAIGRENGEISVQNVKSQIQQAGDASDYEVHIISPGGDVFEGFGIYNLLKNTGKSINIKIEGLCASIATLIAGAGNSISMNRTAEFMVHNPHISDLKGDSTQLRNVAEQLDKIKTLLIDVYQRKTGLPKEKLWELYDNETWLTAQEAQSMGFVDDVQDALKAVAKVDLKTFKMENKETWLSKAFKNLLGLSKIKNQFTETLQDGTIILVMSEDEDWTGKQVIYEDGTPVPAGDHVLASGKTITVDDQSIITQVTEAAPVDNKNEEEEMQKENQIKELEAKLAEANEALAKAQSTATTEAAKSAKFENRMADVEGKYLKLQEEMQKTFGDKTEPAKGPTYKASQDQQEEDPMGQEVLKYFRNRNIIK
jgi:ATP-dependent Clp protease protease subunit